MMDEFALCWNNFADNIASGFQNLYDRGDLVDVTIACDGKLLKAHKIVLAICSPYFQEMFTSNPCKHPIVVLKDVSANVMQELLQFMYQGEVNVKHSELQCFMKIAETLQIKGLTASHKNERSPTPSAHRSSSTSQLDPSKLNSYLAAAAKESLKRAAESTPEPFSSLHYPIKKAIKRSTDSIDQDSNSDCMDNLSSDEAFIPASPQISMTEQSSSSVVAPSGRQFDLSNVKREAAGDSLSSPQQSPTNLATSAAAMGAAAAASAAAAMKLGFSSTPTAGSPALHPMFGGFDHNSSSFSGIATSLASISGNGSNGGAVAVASGSTGVPGAIAAGGLKLAPMDYSGDYGSDYGKGGVPPGHMDIPAGPSITMLSSTSLLHQNCIFNRNNTVATQQGLKTYWLCKSYRVSMCRARCITHHGQVISSTGVHNHPPHMKGPHEFPHQPPQPPPPLPPPPNLGPHPVAPPPQHQEHHIIPHSVNNGGYHEYHPNPHFQPASNHMAMGPPPHHDSNQYPTHPQPSPYPEMPPHHHGSHHYLPSSQHPPYVNPTMPPPPSPHMTLPPSSDPQPVATHHQIQSELPVPGGPPAVVAEAASTIPQQPEVPADIKLTQLEPAVPPLVTVPVAATGDGVASAEQQQQLELKTEPFS